MAVPLGKTPDSDANEKYAMWRTAPSPSWAPPPCRRVESITSTEPAWVAGCGSNGGGTWTATPVGEAASPLRDPTGNGARPVPPPRSFKHRGDAQGRARGRALVGEGRRPAGRRPAGRHNDTERLAALLRLGAVAAKHVGVWDERGGSHGGAHVVEVDEDGEHRRDLALAAGGVLDVEERHCVDV